MANSASLKSLRIPTLSALFLVSVLGVIIIIMPLSTSAVNISMSIPSPEGSRGNTPAETVRNFYSFSLAIAGLLAFGAVVIAAIEYSASGGNPSKQSDAKDRIRSAILGILLLAGAALIFNTINPEITQLQNPALEKHTSGRGAGGITTCPAGQNNPHYVPQRVRYGRIYRIVCKPVSGCGQDRCSL